MKSNDLVAKNIVKQYIMILITKNKKSLGLLTSLKIVYIKKESFYITKIWIIRNN